MAKLQLDPLTQSHLNIKLFTGVKNAVKLRKEIAKGELKCCLVNPKYVLEPFQLLVAANKALTAEKTITKSVYSEILFNMSMSKQIGKSLKQFGIEDESTEFLLLTITKDDESYVDYNELIEGEEADLSVLEKLRDVDAIRETYKIGKVEEASTKLIDSIVTRIAVKDLMSH